MAQQAIAPFHAIIAAENPPVRAEVVLVGDADEDHPLMISGHTWEVARVGATLADAMGPLLRSANTVLLVDRYFDISKSEYRETLQACLGVLNSTGHADVRCEIHFCDHDTRAPTEIVEREAHKWLRGIVPAEMSIALFAWRERAGGEDFHARYLLTDVGGINVEAGFSADGQHQQVQLSLLDFDFSQRKLNALRRGSTIYELVEPVLEVSSDGTVGRI